MKIIIKKIYKIHEFIAFLKKINHSFEEWIINDKKIKEKKILKTLFYKYFLP